MFKKGMDNRGQISAEYLLLLVVTLVILSSVTIPMLTKSVDASNDVSDTSEVKNAVNSIASAVDIVYANGPGAKRTLDIYIPLTLNYETGANYASMSLNLTDSAKVLNTTTSCPITANSTTLTKGWYNTTIQWAAGKTSIDVDLVKTG